VLQFIEDNPMILRFVDHSLKTDKQIVLAALKKSKNKRILQYVDKSLLNAPEILKAIKK
jgi:hypothetical protein